MLTNDLFNTDYERRLQEGAVDRLEQRRIDDLNMKMDDLANRAKSTDNPEHKKSLLKAFLDCKEERDSYYKLREGGIGQDIVNKSEKMARATPPTKTGAVASTVKNAAKWLAGKGGPGREGPTYEGADDVEDRGEYDREGDMAKDNIHTIVRNARELESVIGNDDNLPEWVQDKLANIKGMMTAVSEYMQTQHERDSIVPEGTETQWSKEEPWTKVPKNKAGRPVDPRGEVAHLSDVARREAEIDRKFNTPDQLKKDADYRSYRKGIKQAQKKNSKTVEEGFQDFNKVEPYAVCLAGKPVKKFDYYEQARRFHDNWKQKLYREGDKAKADKITLMPLNLDEGGIGNEIKHGIKGIKRKVAGKPSRQDVKDKYWGKSLTARSAGDNAEADKNAHRYATVHNNTNSGKVNEQGVAEDWIDDNAAEPLARYFADLYYGDFSATEKVKLTAHIYQSIQDGKLSIEQLKADIDMLEKEKGITEAMNVNDLLNKVTKDSNKDFKKAKAGKLKASGDFTKGDHWTGPKKNDPYYTKNFGHGYPDTPSNRSHDRDVKKSLKKDVAEETREAEIDRKFNSPEQLKKDADYRAYRAGVKASRKQPPAPIKEFAPGGTMKPPVNPKQKKDPWGDDNRSETVKTIKRLLDAGNKVDSLLAGARGHIYAVAPDLVGFSMKKYKKPYAKGGLFRFMSGDEDDQVFLKMIKPGYYQLWNKELVDEEKTRLDPKCWKGKKIGNPKTKMKGGVRVNNCVPAESIEEEWSEKYKDSINCSNPKGFSQKAHCAGKKKNEESYAGVMESQGITDPALLEVARKIDLFAKTIK